jgi:hypothetical protein
LLHFLNINAMKKMYTAGIFVASFFLLTSCDKEVKAPQKAASTTASTTTNANKTTTTTTQTQTQTGCGHTCGGGSCGGGSSTSSTSNNNGY